MADAGLILSGIGQGAQAFTNAYQQSQDLALRRAQQQQQADYQNQQLKNQQATLQSGLLNQNQQINPDSGDVEYNELGQTNQDVSLAKAKFNKQARIPGTPESEQTINSYKDAWNELKPGKGDAITKGMTSGSDILDNPDHAAQLNAMMTLHHHDQQHEEQMRRDDIATKKLDAYLKNQGTNTEIRVDKATQGAANAVTQDSTIVKYNPIIQQADNDLALLTSGQKLPSQVTRELARSMAQLIAQGKGSSSEGSETALEFKNLAGDIDRVSKGYLAGNPNYDALSQKQKEEVTGIITRVRDNVARAQGARAIQKYVNYANPALHKAHVDAINGYAPGWKEGQNAKDWLASQRQQEAGNKTVSPEQLDAYSKQHKMDPKAAADFLKGQGYNVQQ